MQVVKAQKGSREHFLCRNQMRNVAFGMIATRMALAVNLKRGLVEEMRAIIEVQVVGFFENGYAGSCLIKRINVADEIHADSNQFLDLRHIKRTLDKAHLVFWQ